MKEQMIKASVCPAVLTVMTSALVWSVAGCSTLKVASRPPKASYVQLSQDTYVKTADEKSVLKHKGDKVELTNAPVLFESPGYVGVLFVPSYQTPTEYKLSLRELPVWGGSSVDRYANQVISEVLSKVTEAEVLLGEHKPQQALDLVQGLEAKYPQVTYLRFLESSCLVMTGSREKAAGVLAEALKEYPQDQQAQTFYRSIAGEKSGGTP